MGATPNTPAPRRTGARSRNTPHNCRSRMRRRNLICAAVAAGCLALAPAALGAMPFARPGANTHNYTDLYLNAGATPDDRGGDSNTSKSAATADPSTGPQINSTPFELYGERGAHIDDADASAQTAWMTTTGRPDVSIAVLDSGIKWFDPSAMSDLRDKIRLNAGELPQPLHDLGTPISHPGTNDCSTYTDAYDANHDAVFNIEDYACDSRVANVLNNDPRRSGPPGGLTPEDLIIAFSDGTDALDVGADGSRARAGPVLRVVQWVRQLEVPGEAGDRFGVLRV